MDWLFAVLKLSPNYLEVLAAAAGESAEGTFWLKRLLNAALKFAPS